MARDWDDFDKFAGTIRKYMPLCGQGDTLASQVCTAVNKLIYKWYNDGDVFDNTHALEGWANNLSSYANWLHKHTCEEAGMILDGIADIEDEGDYEDLLYDLADLLLDEKTLERMNEVEKQGDIYDCDGKFRFEEHYEDDEEEDD